MCCIFVRVNTYMFMLMPLKAKRRCKIPSAGITGICELPAICAGIQTLVLMTEQQVLLTISQPTYFFWALSFLINDSVTNGLAPTSLCNFLNYRPRWSLIWKKVLETQSAGNSHKLNLIEIYTMLMSTLEVVRRKLEMRNTEHLIYRYHFFVYMHMFVWVHVCVLGGVHASMCVCVCHNCMYSSSRVYSSVTFLFSRQRTHWPGVLQFG